jgi:galactitol PTS system EIIC component
VFAGGSFQTFLVSTLGLGINLAAVMFLLPRMVSILMEGLIPISESAREFMQARASGREVYIGLDSAILIGHPAVISSALILVPIAILLSVILPGNRVLLFADLAVIPFVLAILGPICRGNIVRIVIIGTVILTVGFYVGNAIAPLMTQVAATSGFAIPEAAAGATFIVSIADGFFVAAAVLRDPGAKPGLGWVDHHRRHSGCRLVFLQPPDPLLGSCRRWTDCRRA